MAFATFRGEQTLGELVDKLYVNLNARQRADVEAALVKANPQLRDLKAVREGAVLRVPVPSKAQLRGARELESPDDHVAAQVEAAVKQYGEQLIGRVRVEQEDNKAQMALIKDKRLRAVIENSPAAKATAEAAERALTARASSLKERPKAVDDAIKRVLTDLSARPR